MLKLPAPRLPLGVYETIKAGTNSEFVSKCTWFIWFLKLSQKSPARSRFLRRGGDLEKWFVLFVVISCCCFCCWFNRLCLLFSLGGGGSGEVRAPHTREVPRRVPPSQPICSITCNPRRCPAMPRGPPRPLLHRQLRGHYGCESGLTSWDRLCELRASERPSTTCRCPFRLLDSTKETMSPSHGQEAVLLMFKTLICQNGSPPWSLECGL